MARASSLLSTLVVDHVRARARLPGAAMVGTMRTTVTGSLFLYSRSIFYGAKGISWRAQPLSTTNNSGFVIIVVRNRAAGSRNARCGAVHLTIVVGGLDLWDCGFPGGIPDAAVDGVSHRLSALHDPVACDHLLPTDIPASINGFTIGSERPDRAWYSCCPARECDHPAELHAQCRRGMQRNTLTAFFVSRGCRLRVLGRAGNVEKSGYCGGEHSNCHRDERPSYCRDGFAECPVRTDSADSGAVHVALGLFFFVSGFSSRQCLSLHKLLGLLSRYRDPGLVRA